jgi:transposase-like protein
MADKSEALPLNGSGIRDTARVLGIRPQTVMAQLKKRWSR